MSHSQIVRAWKDEDFRLSLSPEALAALPENPAGPVALEDADLNVSGAGELTIVPRSFCFCPSKSICSLCDCF